MPDYDLRGLSPRSFEKLIQALAGEELGGGIVTFGDGPDGGREATFEGRMGFPSKEAPWDGYCVVQAKFRQKPEGRAKDATWLRSELERELKAFADPKQRRRRPEYYLLATNIVLTPVQGRGGKDRIATLLRKHIKEVPIRDFRVWDGDEIARLLDTHEEIRKANAAWVTSGDVLSQALETLSGLRDLFLDIRSQFANLEQAGHATEDRIPLAQAFVGLLSTAISLAAPPSQDDEKKGEVMEVATQLVDQARDAVDPLTTHSSPTENQEQVLVAKDWMRAAGHHFISLLVEAIRQQKDRDHDLVVEHYGLPEEMFPRRAPAPVQEHSDEARAQALYRSRKRLRHTLEELIAFELPMASGEKRQILMACLRLLE